MTELEIARKAVQLYAETHPRPTQVTQTEAAKMLNVSRPTISRMVKSGHIKLNGCGMVPITEVDRVISVSR